MKQLLVFVLILLSACSEEIISPARSIPQAKEHPVKLVWKKYMNPSDTAGIHYSVEPWLWQDQILYTAEGLNDGVFIVSRKKETGTLKWAWSDPTFDDFSSTRSFYLSWSSLLFTDQQRIYNLDLNTQSHLSQRRLDYNSPRMSVFADLVMNSNGDASVNDNKTILSIYNTSDLSFRAEYVIFKENGYSPDIEPPIGDINLNGDTILYFVCRWYNFSLGDPRSDVYAYNLSQDSIVWHQKDIFPTGNTSVYAPLQDDEYLYVPGQATPICIRKSDGKIMWKTELPSGFTDCNPVLHNGVLYLNGQDEKFFALDAATGSVLWTINDESYSGTQMQVYNERLYYTSSGSGKLFCLDISSRKVLWAYDSPTDDGNIRAGFWHGMIIDPSTGYLYTSDGWYMMCIDLNKME